MSKANREFNLKEELLDCSYEQYFYSRSYEDYSMRENFVGDFYENTKNISIIDLHEEYEYTDEEYEDLESVEREAEEFYNEKLDILKEEQEYFYNCVIDNITKNIQIIYGGCWFEPEEELSKEEYDKQEEEKLKVLAIHIEEEIQDELNYIFKKQIEIIEDNFHSIEYILVE